MRHKIWAAVSSAGDLAVILGVAGAVAGNPKAAGPRPTQAPAASSSPRPVPPSPQPARSPARGPSRTQAAGSAAATAENACDNRPLASGDIYVRMIVPGTQPQAQELGGEWGWNNELNECETSVQRTISTAPMTAGSCTQVGYAADNPDYDPDAVPAPPLTNVAAQAGPAC